MDNLTRADEPLRELALFAGAGGGILGGKLLGWRTVCAVELDAYAAGVLCARQNDGSIEAFPIWADVRTFDGRPWRGIVDVVSGGFPCQDISIAGKGAGIDGIKSGLWSEFARIIGEVRPRFAFVENSPALLTRGFERVVGDLAAIGYDTRWCVLGAADLGAPHRRDRVWIVATDAASIGCNPGGLSERAETAVSESAIANLSDDSDVDRSGLQERRQSSTQSNRIRGPKRDDWWRAEPDVVRVVHGLPARVDRIRALGNAQVPAVAAAAWRMLTA